MPLIEYGTAGPPMLYLPSSGGDQNEFARYGMVEVAAPWLERGLLRIYSADARGPQTLFAPKLEPPQRMRGYVAVERYLSTELLPWILERSAAGRLAVVGSSYGAFAAANLLFKQPALVSRACGLGGVYEMWHRLDGFHDADVYHHTPLEYLPRLEAPAILEAIRATDGIDLYAAADDSWLAETRHLANVLQKKRLPHRVSVAPSPANHHERWWRRQFRDYLERSLGWG